MPRFALFLALALLAGPAIGQQASPRPTPVDPSDAIFREMMPTPVPAAPAPIPGFDVRDIIILPAPARPYVPPLAHPMDAKIYLGREVIIEGVVTKARNVPKSNVALEIDGPSKGKGDAPFVAFVRGESLLEITRKPTAPDARAWLEKLISRRLRVTGTVELYKGRPQIVVTRREQLEALD